MRFIENEVIEYKEEYTIDGIYKSIRDAAAITYQTDIDKMKKTPKEFVYDVLLKNGHTRPLEFGTVYLRIPLTDRDAYMKYFDCLKYPSVNPMWTKIVHPENDEYVYITTNFRVIMQGEYKTDEWAFNNNYDKNWVDDIEKYYYHSFIHIPRWTYKIYISRGCADDLRTHIALSGLMESSRFCNYGKDKFGNELTFIRPYWISKDVIDDPYCFKLNERIANENLSDGATLTLENQYNFLRSMKQAEIEYIKCSKMGLQAQQLKRIYPLGAKVELRLCGYIDAWTNFLWRRDDKHADPECQIVSKIIRTKNVDLSDTFNTLTFIENHTPVDHVVTDKDNKYISKAEAAEALKNGYLVQPLEWKGTFHYITREDWRNKNETNPWGIYDYLNIGRDVSPNYGFFSGPYDENLNPIPIVEIQGNHIESRDNPESINFGDKWIIYDEWAASMKICDIMIKNKSLC